MITRKPQALAAELDSFLSERGLSEKALAIAVSKENQGIEVSQPWISRLRNGEFKRITTKARAVFAYANIPVVTHKGEISDEGRLLIEKALSDVWDGSTAEAAALADVIRACSKFAK